MASLKKNKKKKVKHAMPHNGIVLFYCFYFIILFMTFKSISTLLSMETSTQLEKQKASEETAPEKRKLPKPTGPFMTGITQMHIVDTARSERHHIQNNRELLLTIWYPACVSKRNSRSSYGGEITEFIKTDLSNMSEVSIDKLYYLNELKNHSYKNAPMAFEEEQFPVLIFSPGFGAPVFLYTSILEDLASHGYIVIGINYPYVTNPVLFPNGTLIKQAEMYTTGSKSEIVQEKNKEFDTWVTDIQFLIAELKKIHNGTSEKNLLKKKLDLNRIGVFGHSFGGSVALKINEIDNRCKAGVSIEGKIYGKVTSLKSPFMFIVASHEEEILKPTKDLLGRLTEPSYYAEIEGTDHGSFTDIYFLAPVKKPTLMAPMQAIEITRCLLINFFDKYLKNVDTALNLEAMIKQNPEINLVTNIQ